MSGYRNVDYPVLAKRGFLLGLALFALGALGHVVGHVVLPGLPGWTDTLFLYLEEIGVLLGLLAPVVFGIVLPLTE